MPDARFPVEMVSGVPVVVTPEEIDITNADGLRAALLEAAAHGQAREAGGRHEPDPVLRHGRHSRAGGGAQAGRSRPR